MTSVIALFHEVPQRLKPGTGKLDGMQPVFMLLFRLASYQSINQTCKFQLDPTVHFGKPTSERCKVELPLTLLNIPTTVCKHTHTHKDHQQTTELLVLKAVKKKSHHRFSMFYSMSSSWCKKCVYGRGGTVFMACQIKSQHSETSTGGWYSRAGSHMIHSNFFQICLTVRTKTWCVVIRSIIMISAFSGHQQQPKYSMSWLWSSTETGHTASINPLLVQSFYDPVNKKQCCKVQLLTQRYVLSSLKENLWSSVLMMLWILI